MDPKSQNSLFPQRVFMEQCFLTEGSLNSSNRPTNLPENENDVCVAFVYDYLNIPWSPQNGEASSQKKLLLFSFYRLRRGREEFPSWLSINEPN